MFGLPVWCYLFFLPAAFFLLHAVFQVIYGIIELDVERKHRAIEDLIWAVGIGVLTVGGLFCASAIVKHQTILTFPAWGFTVGMVGLLMLCVSGVGLGFAISNKNTKSKIKWIIIIIISILMLAVGLFSNNGCIHR